MEQIELQNLIDSWNSIQRNAGLGLYKKGFSSEGPVTIYTIAEPNTKRFGIGFSFPKDIRFNLDVFKKLSEITIKIIDDTSFPEHIILLIILEDKTIEEIFSVFCLDLLECIKECPTQRDASIAITNRVIDWLKLFNKKGREILGKEEQDGLYGELTVLIKLLEETTNDKFFDIVSSWTGPERKPQDFQNPEWALEVKTSTGKKDNIIEINGKLQLDYGNIYPLFLIHLAFIKNTGETLPECIERIRNLLNSNQYAKSLFNAKLIKAGFDDEMSSEYNTRYTQRYIKYYQVTEDFPRITESDLKEGIIDVSYTLDLVLCNNYLVDFQSLKSILSL